MNAKKYTIQELSKITGAEVFGDPSFEITGVEALELATASEASFLANLRYKELMLQSQAGVICISKEITPASGKNYLITDNPSLCFQIIAELFLSQESNKSGFSGIHPSAVIHPSVILGKNVRIGPHVAIDQNTTIGDSSDIGSGVFIGHGVTIGDHCTIHPNAIIRERCEIGNRVIIQPGAVIGSCGFGYTTDSQGNHKKLDQLGIVILEDDVEVGANTTIDRARFSKTLVSKGTKIDNLVQIGHNVRLGPNNIIISQSGIAGSAKTGRNVVLGGQSGIVGHVEIADFVMIATRGGVSKSLPQSGKFAGGPVMPLSDYNRQQVHLRKISDYVKEIEELKKLIEELREHLPELTAKKK